MRGSGRPIPSAAGFAAFNIGVIIGSEDAGQRASLAPSTMSDCAVSRGRVPQEESWPDDIENCSESLLETL